jgi:predicted nucleic acid-binding protein
MKVFFDTSVLVAALVKAHPRHVDCLPCLDAAKTSETEEVKPTQIQGVLSTHSFAECYAVLTRLPVRPRITPEIAQELILTNLLALEAIPLSPALYQKAIERLVGLNLVGGVMFDALLAEAALAARAEVLLTGNLKDFRRLGADVAELACDPKDFLPQLPTE